MGLCRHAGGWLSRRRGRGPGAGWGGGWLGDVGACGPHRPRPTLHMRYGLLIQCVPHMVALNTHGAHGAKGEGQGAHGGQGASCRVSMESRVATAARAARLREAADAPRDSACAAASHAALRRRGMARTRIRHRETETGRHKGRDRPGTRIRHISPRDRGIACRMHSDPRQFFPRGVLRDRR